MAHDTETGEATECYTQVTFGNATKLPANYSAMQQSVRHAVAAQFGTDVE